jgi:flagellar basal body-associated protein FliL
VASTPAPPRAGLTPQVVAMFALILVAEAVLLTLMLRRVEGAREIVQGRDLARMEYVDLETVNVPVKSARAATDVVFPIRVEASVLVVGDGPERTRAKEEIGLSRQKIADEVARTVGALSAEQAVDPGNRERLKDRLRSALNQSVFKREVVQEVVFRYYGP